MSAVRSRGFNFFAKTSTCVLAGAAILGGLTLPAAAQGATKIATQSAPKTAAKTAAHETVSRPHVYLMRGLLNIFSLGMDQLAVAIRQHGIDASVYNHTYEGTVADRIAQMYRAGDHGPYILVGHSLGADAVMTMAQELNSRNVPVALVVPFDGTGSYAASRNVACVVNLTQRAYAYMRAGPGFHGMLTNVDVSNDGSIDHFTIDKSPRLQAQALRYVLQTAHAEACRPGTAAPVVARPKEGPAVKPLVPAQSASPSLRPGIAG